MKTRYYLYITTALALLLAALGSCRKFVAIEPAPNLINSPTVFTGDATALSAMSGVYTQMRQLSNGITNGGLSLFTGLSGDELYNTASSALYDPFFKDSVPSSNDRVERNLWTDAYAVIYRANAILEGLNGASGVSDAVRNQLRGEALVVRSLCYFYLVNLFGDVPLVTATSYQANEKMPRTPAAQVYQHLTGSLLEAESLLAPDYSSPGKVRPNKWTATALLARLYLYTQNWPAAEEKASAVIGSGSYSLVANPANTFLKGSTETLWEIAPRNETGNTVEGTNFIPASATARPALALTASLLNSFVAADKRKTNWTRTVTVNGTPYTYPFKYKVRTSTPVTEYNIVLRLAEQYLVRSEARLQQGNLPGSLDDLNVVRKRAGLTDTTVASAGGLSLALEQERRVELFAEWGHRWFDLKRTGRINTVMSSEKPFWRPFAALYPIPFNQIQVNGALTQNPGYE